MRRKICMLLATVLAFTMMLGMSMTALAVDVPVHHFDITVQPITSADFGDNLPTNNCSASPAGMNADVTYYAMYDSSKDLKYLCVMPDTEWQYLDSSFSSVDNPDFSDIAYVIEVITCYVNNDNDDFASDLTVRCNERDMQSKTIDLAEMGIYTEGFMIYSGMHSNVNVLVAVEVYNTSNGSSGSKGSSHEHHYEWHTIVEPTQDKDGLEGEVCSCGATRNIQSLSAYGYALNKYATSLINAAKAGQTVTFEFGEWNSFPKSFMEKIASRNDVTFVFHYKWNHVSQEVVIPAGTAIDLNFNWYGPAKMAELYGAK